MSILANLTVKWTTSDKMLADAIGKMIDLDAVIERLQAVDCQNCSLFTKEQVRFAFLKWIEHHIESIEMQPEWYINRDFRYFERNLPFNELQEATDLREDDFEEACAQMYAEMCAESALEAA